ncbi:MAG: hypothetical protein BWY19_01216 [bacterium ADurb.Bin212]|nr:MAG: hypothetical protein BWY19_01216 [bacterium ADurb.Bin212]
MKTGWIPYSTVIPTLGTADAPSYPIVFAGVDLTSMLGVGMKVKFTQNSATVFGIITAISFSTNTTVTLYCGTDYSVANTGTYPITNFNYSTQKAPLNFPTNPEKWTVTLTDTTLRRQSNPTTNTLYNVGNLNIVIPIGLWITKCQLTLGWGRYSTGQGECKFALSTSTSSISTTDFNGVVTGCNNATSSATDVRGGYYREKVLSLAAKATYYTLIFTSQDLGNEGFIDLRNDLVPLYIKAICAYL